MARAMEATERRDWPAALEALDACLAMDEKYNEDANCLHDRSICLFHLGKKSEALAGLDSALALDPNYSYRYASRAWMRNATGDIHGAIEDYRKAIELDPEDAIAHNNLGLLEEQLGYRSQAKERFAIADELSGILQDRGIDVRPGEPENLIDNAAMGPTEAAQPEDMTTPQTRPELPKWRSFVRETLFTKKGRQEFLDFIRNGFKL